jgi:hypothetical protein
MVTSREHRPRRDRRARHPRPVARHVSASPSTWYRLVPKHGWRRLGLHVHPLKPKVGLWPNARWRRRALTIQHAAVKRTSSPVT